MAMAGDETKAPKEPTAAERREQSAEEKEAERAEAQRQLAERLRYGPIRDAE
jgi:hypothetical protein